MNSRPVRTSEDTDALLKMVQIGPGKIKQRDDRKASVWETEISAFSVSAFQLTNGIYATVKSGLTLSNDRSQIPIVNVSWLQAVRFCNLLSRHAGLNPCYQIEDEKGENVRFEDRGGYRLPTDAEWEFACRAGSTAARYGPIEDIAWFAGNSNGSAKPVGLKKPNQWGLYDTLGNVWEWCSDLYDPEVYGAYRVFRGGGWADEERGVLAGNRRRSHPTFAIDDLGFRVARTLGS